MASTASRQSGAFRLDQVGVPASTASRRVRQGAWARVQPRVLVAEGSTPGRLRDAVAAQLSVGADGLVSDAMAAWILGLIPSPPATTLLVLPYQRRGTRERPGVNLLCTTAYAPAGRRVVHGIALPCVEWVLCDLAREVGFEGLCRAIAHADRRRLTTLARLARLADRRGRFEGRPLLARALAGLNGELSHSGAERSLRKALSGLGAVPHPRPLLVERAGRRIAELDIAFVPALVDVEVDGPHHLLAAQASTDRARDRQLILALWLPLRFMAWDVDADVRRCAREIVALVDARLRNPPTPPLDVRLSPVLRR